MLSTVQIRLRSLTLAAAAALTGCAGTGAPADEAQAEEHLATDSPVLPPIEVHASWRMAVTGVPTYGYDATTPFMKIKIRVDDRGVRREHPGFDGLESAFALLPRADGSGVRWERIALPFRAWTLVGYIETRPIDIHESDPIRLSPEDLALAERLGVSVSLVTNVGEVQACSPSGQANFPLEHETP